MSSKRSGGVLNIGMKWALSSYRNALFLMTVLALIPHLTWIAMSFNAFIVLRLGWKKGAFILAPALFVYIISLSRTIGLEAAIITGLLTYVPCYIGACILRLMQSWQIVVYSYFLLLMVCACLVQLCMPEFVAAQYMMFQGILKSLSADDIVLKTVIDNAQWSKSVLANIIFGLQITSIVVSAVVSLLLARGVQARIYYPEGLKQELLNFRGDKASVMVGASFVVAAYCGSILAINGLPFIMLYFMAAGMSLIFHIFSKKRVFSIVCLLLIPMFFVPFILFPVYTVLGVMDAVFNFRARHLAFER